MASDEEARGSASMTNTGLVIVVLTLAGAAGALVWKSIENNRARPAHTPLDITTLEVPDAVRGQHNGDPATRAAPPVRRTLSARTRQPDAVVRHMRTTLSPRWDGAMETILKTYTIDGLSREAAMRCTGYLAEIDAGLGNMAIRRGLARNCPTLNRNIAQGGGYR